MEKKILVQFQSEGYVINPNHPELSKSICYGGIVIEILNKYYGNTVKSDNMGIAKIQELQNLLSRSTISFTSLVDPWLGNLPLIASDRARFVKQISDKRKQIIISPRTVEIEYYWDNDRQAIGQQAYVEKIDDLLAYDICKVLESNMVIKQCYCKRYFIASRKSMKYCQEHRAEGQRITRQENLKNDRCRVAASIIPAAACLYALENSGSFKYSRKVDSPTPAAFAASAFVRLVRRACKALSLRGVVALTPFFWWFLRLSGCLEGLCTPPPLGTLRAIDCCAA